MPPKSFPFVGEEVSEGRRRLPTDQGQGVSSKVGVGHRDARRRKRWWRGSSSHKSTSATLSLEVEQRDKRMPSLPAPHK